VRKEELFARIDAHSAEAVARGRALFACPEPGFHEKKTEELICAALEAWGVPYRRDLALTGVAATVGRGGFHVAVTADMDALPRRRGGYIHSCGHSIQTADALTALQALLEADRAEPLPGRVSFFFTPAEELTDPEEREKLIACGTLRGRSGKQEMIAQGVFDGVDCVLSCHANAETGRRFDIDSVLAGFVLKRAVFRGRAAHSGAAPFLGRSALHGAVLAENALAFLKDQYPPAAGVCIHPVLRDVTGGVNIIPDRAVLETYVRAADRTALLDASARFDTCVRGCARALGLRAELTTKPGYLPLCQSPALCRAAERSMLAFVSPAEITRHPVSGASGDIGDLGTLLPCVQFGFSGIQGGFHTDSFAVRDEEFCYVTAAKVLAGTVAEVLQTPEYQARNPDFLRDKEDYLRSWLG